MGLDAWIFSLPREVESETDFNVNEHEEPEYIAYWRKNWELHQFLYSIYDEKGGLGEFNCNRLALNEDDLDLLEIFFRDLDYKHNVDLGWSSIDEPTSLEYDLVMLEEARVEIKKGHTVYYDSWW